MAGPGSRGINWQIDEQIKEGQGIELLHSGAFDADKQAGSLPALCSDGLMLIMASLTMCSDQTTVDLLVLQFSQTIEVSHMAKRGRGGVNVSQLVRDYKSQHKRSKPKDIAEALNKQGVKISSQYVSTILSNWRRKKGRRVRAAAGAAESNGRGGGISIAQLVKAKKLVKRLGGVDQAKKMVDALSKILD